MATEFVRASTRRYKFTRVKVGPFWRRYRRHKVRASAYRRREPR